MFRKRWLSLGALALLGGGAAQAQDKAVLPGAPAKASAAHVLHYQPGESPPPSQGEGAVLRPGSTPDPFVATPTPEEGPKYGPTLPEDVKLLQNALFGEGPAPCGIRTYGWADAGFTYASSGPGPLTVEPRENRFGNEFLVNQLALVIDKPLDPKELSFGFNVTYYAGADAALLQPKGGLDDPPGNPRFSHDFRQLYVAAHLPIITDGGVDVKAGRMGTIIGYESALAPYRPFYSNDYQWFYAEDGAFTGILANLHVSKQLDVINGITWGANTFFTQRGNGPCYIGQVNYWLTEEKNTLLSASVYLGNNAIFAAPGLAGDFDTTIELRVQHKWSKQLEQVIQSDMGWDANTPVGTGQWYSLYTIVIYHLTEKLDVNTRIEWFDDVRGTRTGFDTNYSETTLGFDYHPVKALSLRPEVRGDYAGDRVFRNGRDHSQLTLAVDALLKF